MLSHVLQRHCERRLVLKTDVHHVMVEIDDDPRRSRQHQVRVGILAQYFHDGVVVRAFRPTGALVVLRRLLPERDDIAGALSMRAPGQI